MRPRRRVRVASDETPLRDGNKHNAGSWRVAQAVKNKKTKAPLARSERGPAVPPHVVREVWARAGGICTFPGCGSVLYRDPHLNKSAAFGEVAHNVAASPNGERGDPQRSRALCHEPNNLILFCPTHHTLVDRPGAASDYPDHLLEQWKLRHEAAIRTAGIMSGTTAHALVLQGSIGQQTVAFAHTTIPHAMLQHDLVLEREPTLLSIDTSGYAPKSPAYWTHAITRVREMVRLHQSTLGHLQRPLAVFALADMPTLVALGFALGHAAAVTVFQYNPVGNGGDWRFPNFAAPAPEFRVHWPDTLSGEIALVISLSGPIEHDRVRACLSPATCSIIELSVDQPTVDFVLGPATIEAFARTFRSIVAKLEGLIAKTTIVHVFPAMPASLAVTFGRFIKPKVSFPFRIYDAQGRDAPFEHAVSLPFPDAADGVAS